MRLKYGNCVLMTALAVLASFGCGKPAVSVILRIRRANGRTAKTDPAADPTKQLPHPLVGKKRILTLANATLHRDLECAESTRLEIQTLDKLSLAPWRLSGTNVVSNAPATSLRPLLEDLIQRSVMRISQNTNQSANCIRCSTE